MVLGIVAIFAYVGGEVSIGSFIISFVGLEEIAGLEEAKASNYLAFYWGGAMIGRFLGAISLSEIQPQRKTILMIATSILTFLALYGMTYGKAYLAEEEFGVSLIDLLPYVGFLFLNLIAFFIGKSLAGRTLGIFSLVCIFLIATAIFLTGEIAMWALLSIGLFNSIMWPNIFTLAIKGLGKHTSQGSSLLVMAILGGALIPVAQGFLADYIGVQNSFIVPLICYVYIMYYGFVGSKSK